MKKITLLAFLLIPISLYSQEISEAYLNSLPESVKLSRFGSFNFKKTPKRLGRNPKTKDSYIIPVLNKLNFKPSTKIKENIN